MNTFSYSNSPKNIAINKFLVIGENNKGFHLTHIDNSKWGGYFKTAVCTCSNIATISFASLKMFCNCQYKMLQNNNMLDSCSVCAGWENLDFYKLPVDFKCNWSCMVNLQNNFLTKVINLIANFSKYDSLALEWPHPPTHPPPESIFTTQIMI